MTTATIEAPKKAARAETILQRSVCLLLRCGHVGNTRQVELSSVEMRKGGDLLGGEKSEVTASKRLFAAGDLRACESVLSGAKQYLRSVTRTNAHRIFGTGTHLIPVAVLTEVEDRLAWYQADLAAAVEKMVAGLPDAIAARKVKLGPLFNAADYPTADEVRDEYSLDWSYVSFAAPERLEEVDRAVYERAQAKYQGQLAAAYDEVVVGLRESALLVMKELAKRLAPNAEGKPKALQPTALRDLQDLLGRLPVLDLTGDDALMQAVAKVGGIAGHLDVDVLRKAPGVRDMLLQAAEAAVEELDGLVALGKRGISFGPLAV